MCKLEPGLQAVDNRRWAMGGGQRAICERVALPSLVYAAVGRLSLVNDVRQHRGSRTDTEGAGQLGATDRLAGVSAPAEF